jgi:hypothetical protein
MSASNKPSCNKPSLQNIRISYLRTFIAKEEFSIVKQMRSQTKRLFWKRRKKKTNDGCGIDK